MERKFGIELEITGITMHKASTALRAVGINVESQGYNHNTCSCWKLVSDASVRGGFEVVSPVLYGEAGLAEAKKVANALSGADATANRSCGMHVHFDAADLSPQSLYHVLNRYSKYETAIDAFMPISRRASNNNYCRPLHVFMNNISSNQTINQMAHSQGGRYFKVNLQSFLRYGTIEFRQHSGTVNAAKIENWVRFLADFINTCKNVNLTANNVLGDVLGEAVNVPTSLRGVQKRLADMFIAHNNELALNDICANFNWQAHSARAAITRLRQAGMNITTRRGSTSQTYVLHSGTPVQNGAVYPPAGTIADSLWVGISESVVEFYRNRTAVLAAV